MSTESRQKAPSVSEKLRPYKAKDAYNYVSCGHVKNINYRDRDSEFCALKSKILRSQKAQGFSVRGVSYNQQTIKRLDC